ncbi:MAG: hypothetical protein ACP5U2_01860, partial [Bryobacteraceae bacterium]
TGLPDESWTALLEGRARRDDHVYVEWTGEDGPDARVVIAPEGGSWPSTRVTTRCCSTARDPLEMTNLYHQPAAQPQVRRLREKLLQWQRREKDALALEES